MSHPDPDPKFELDSTPLIFNVHHVALQEIDKIVGNELTLDASDTTRIRGILFSALSEEHRRT